MKAPVAWRNSAWIALAAVVVLSAGCGGKTAAKPGTADYQTTRAMSNIYSAYLFDHANQAPKDEQAFRDYLGGQQQLLEKYRLTIDQMFASPRGGAPFQWAYGAAPPRGPSGMQYFGYETTPVDGKRLVIGARGMFEELDEAQFKKIFPNVR